MLSETHDLSSGDPPWSATDYDCPDPHPLPERSEVAIIGAGIMGATLAERLTAAGHRVTLLDRRKPAHGSTAASTAHIMWAMDVPMLELSESIGEAECRRRWVRVFRAVKAYSDRIDRLGIECRKHERPTLYLSGTRLDDDGLKLEARLHRMAGLPTRFLDADETAERFQIAPRACLLSDGGFEVDPTLLALGMLKFAASRGARTVFPCDVTAISHDRRGLTLELADGRKTSAETVIFAGGYDRAPLLLPPEFRLMSTFAMATEAGSPALWRERAMIWEASDPYIYIRSTADGRIVAGGEDVELADPVRRDQLMNGKAGTIATRSAALLGEESPLLIDRRWAATFGSSPDGLPAIGRAANMPGVWLAAGFGGNGIAFASLAAEMLASELAGRPDPDAPCFDPYRFSSAKR